jgi:hypothetical protein
VFGSGIIDVAIGVFFLYLLLSLVCSSLTEGIARILALRSKNLQEGIRNFLNDPKDGDVVKRIYEHPLVKGLYRKGLGDTLLGRDGKPSYIPSRTFALALFDVVAPADKQGKSKTFAEVRDTINKLPNEDLKKMLLLNLNNANGQLNKARENLQGWFDDAMERVSGWYKRKAQLIILGVAVLVSFALNADTFTYASSLWNDTALRESVVAAAQRTTEQDLSKNIGEIRQEVTKLNLPLGWQSFPSTPLEWLAKALGLLFTAAALSLGAPFWFDVLNRFVRIRSAGETPST